jgi:hypothetical protein
MRPRASAYGEAASRYGEAAYRVEELIVVQSRPGHRGNPVNAVSGLDSAPPAGPRLLWM